ncbi:hypothetical protein RFI_14066 [Reticulomyxa filosa]|uniref:Mitochondrial carrier protein n=1 Tax=Reticulomyxa filosa TaxID=46433 RepID=X6NBG9_RETFI|nr:hypothetical protein RFI_14066 [Reticulomyxa filosa]|eukprot:ETO23119.1 hypothetical protein RFI_14066 [Reticulomyxa filosa]
MYQATLLNVRAEGLVALWKGLIPTLWRDVPFSGMYWMGYEMLKNHFHNKLEMQHTFMTDTPYTLNMKNAFYVGFISGAISGTFASILTHPFDVLKTRRQSILIGIGNSSKTKMQQREDASFKNSLKIILKTNGFKGLFAGITARLAKVPLACATMISVYEAGKSVFNQI